MCVRLFVIALALSLSPTPVLAQNKSPDTVSGDPKEKICETITVTGSRLGKKRFCGTRAEWAEKRLRDRQDVERAQSMSCMLTHNSSGGKPAC